MVIGRPRCYIGMSTGIWGFELQKALFCRKVCQGVQHALASMLV